VKHEAQEGRQAERDQQITPGIQCDDDQRSDYHFAGQIDRR
jgi:hypothetical protein